MGHPLDPLTVHELTTLERLLRSGRVGTATPESDLVSFGFPREIARGLLGFLGSCPSMEIATVVVGAYLQGKQSVPAIQQVIQVVWSGPDCPGTYPRDTRVIVDELFRSATSEVLVAGYAIYNGREVFKELARRMEVIPDLKVRLFLNVHARQGSSEVDTLAQFARSFREEHWSGTRFPEVYYDPRSLDPNPAIRASLHAKCVLCDRRVALVTSANFTNAAQEKNIELGVVLKSIEKAGQIAALFETLVTRGQLKRLSLDHPPVNPR